MTILHALVLRDNQVLFALSIESERVHDALMAADSLAHDAGGYAVRLHSSLDLKISKAPYHRRIHADKKEKAPDADG